MTSAHDKCVLTSYKFENQFKYTYFLTGFKRLLLNYNIFILCHVVCFRASPGILICKYGIINRVTPVTIIHRRDGELVKVEGHFSCSKYYLLVMK